MRERKPKLAMLYTVGQQAREHKATTRNSLSNSGLPPSKSEI